MDKTITIDTYVRMSYPDLPDTDTFLQYCKIAVFNFSTPFKNAEFREFFEESFIERFLTDDISFDTFDLFRIKLKNKMRFVIPVYEPFFEKILDGNYFEGERVTNTTKGRNVDKGENSSNSKNIGADYPINMIEAADDMESVNYASNGSMSKLQGSNKNIHTSKNENVTTRDIPFVDRLAKIPELLTKFENLLNEFNDLFLGVF